MEGRRRRGGGERGKGEGQRGREEGRSGRGEVMTWYGVVVYVRTHSVEIEGEGWIGKRGAIFPIHHPCRR